MARIARIVIPNYAHHIIQRGNRRQNIFFSDADRKAYLEYLRLSIETAGVSIWAYCLMDNHVHFIAVPKDKDSFAKCFSTVHWKYTRRINFRQGWRGYLWEGRFKSFLLSQNHLYAAIRYVERNPVRAKIVEKAWQYPWSSAKSHIHKKEDLILSKNFFVEEIGDWQKYIDSQDNPQEINLFKKHIKTSRPLGDEIFIEKLKQITGHIIGKKKPGPKK